MAIFNTGSVRLSNQPAVMMNYIKSTQLPVGLQARMGILGGAGYAPSLSLAETIFEYHLYRESGTNPINSDSYAAAAHKSTVIEFGVDAFMDIQKSIVAGAAGSATGAVIGSFIPVPILGTLIGAGVGMG